MINNDEGVRSSQPPGWWILALAALLLAVFLLYFNDTTSLLPLDAGPDEAAHNDAAKFILEHKRLAVLPDDQDQLLFTRYGGTRSLRPPLSYLMSAVMAAIHPAHKVNMVVALRKGSAVLGALTVVLVFVTLWIYFASWRLALLGAALVGFLPQFAFISSYNNDDSGAIFAGSALILALVLLHRKGLNVWTALTGGGAAGLVLLAKQSAWMLLPIALAYVLLFVRARPMRMLRLSSLALCALVLCGGWWILHNMYHYGPGDPFAMRITATMADQYAHFSPDREFGYAPQGVGYADLLFNHDNFLVKTYKSTIGNLDWLRLRVGPLHYALYLFVFFVAIAYYPLKGAASIRSRVGGRDVPRTRDFVFELLMLAAVALQFFMYLWANIHNDIQVQGKYLLPVIVAVLIPFSAALRSIWGVSDRLCRELRGHELALGQNGLRNVALAAALAVVIGLHLDSLYHYVVRFYRPTPVRLHIGQFTKVELADSDIVSMHNMELLDQSNGVLYLNATDEDPWMVLKPRLCGKFKDGKLLRIDLESDRDDEFRIYWDRGGGFAEKDMRNSAYKEGEQRFYINLNIRHCRRIRLDPITGPGQVRIKGLAVAPLSVERIYDR